MMRREHVLIFAGWLSAAIAVLHLIIIFLGASAYRYFGAGEDMARQAEGGSLFPAALTFCIAAVFAVFALYAFAGAGLFRRPPLLRTGLVVIATIYIVRGLSLLPELSVYMAGSDTMQPRTLGFSFVSLMIGLFYLVGTVLLWPKLHPARRKMVSRHTPE